MRKSKAKKLPATDAKLIPEEIALAVRLIQAFANLKQGPLGRRALIDPSALSRYSNGVDTPCRDILERLAGAAGKSLSFIENIVVSARALGASPVSRSADHLAEEAACRVAALLAPPLAALTSPESWLASPTAPSALDWAEAEALWQRLVPYPHEERRLIVGHGRSFGNWALAEFLCEASADAAAKSAATATELAALALCVAERVPGGDPRRLPVVGYCHGFVGNARRVANDLPGSAAAFALAWALFPAGGGEYAGLLDEARLLDLESSLDRDHGCHREALSKLDRAMKICNPSIRWRLLVNKAVTLEQSGDPAGALAALVEARPAVERGEGGPRARRLLQFNMVKNLHHLGQPLEAEALLPELRRLVADSGDDLDILRTRALCAQVLASLGRRAEALAELAAVRQGFAEIPLPADAAIIGLHEAEILVLAAETGKVRRLVRAMAPIFESLGLRREGLASYRLFVATVEQEAATVAMVRDLAAAIKRGARGLGDAS